MHGPAPVPWHLRPVDEARRIHEHYVRTVPDRVERFSSLIEDAGFPVDDAARSGLDAFDDLWYWAHDHLSIFTDRDARVRPAASDSWTPFIPGCVLAPDWPSFNGHPDLTDEAQEFASGMAAMLADHAVEHWHARWTFGSDPGLDESLQLRSVLEIPRHPDNPGAEFGPVRISPEQLMARSLRGHHPDPLWIGAAPWHRLHQRVRGPFTDWTQLFRDDAEEFHDLYVGGHLRRLSDFRAWLRARGLDTRSMAFDSIEDLDLVWAWAMAHVEFDEQTRLPGTEWRTWYPTLGQGAAPSFEPPRWDEIRLSANTLTFASGLAACATEVALRRWGADWHLGGRRGDLPAVNRTHLYVKPGPDRLETWINVEREIAEWMSEAVVRARRTPPRPAMWRHVIGETELIAQFTALYEVPPPPWLAWRARCEPRLLPESVGTRAGSDGDVSDAIGIDEPTREPAAQPLVPIPPEPAPPVVDEPVPVPAVRSEASAPVPPMVWQTEVPDLDDPPETESPPPPVTEAEPESPPQPVTEAVSESPPQPVTEAVSESPPQPVTEAATTEPGSQPVPGARLVRSARSEIAERLAAVISLERAGSGPVATRPEPATPEVARPEPTDPEPGQPETPAPRDSDDAADAAIELRVEPDDAAGDRNWVIDVGTILEPVDPELVDRFARRLNRAKGVMHADVAEPGRVQLQMNRFGRADLDAVETLVGRVWHQTRSSHQGAVLIAPAATF